MSTAASAGGETSLLEAWLQCEDLLDRITAYNPAFGEFRRVLGHEDVARRLSLADVASMLDSPEGDIVAIAGGAEVAMARSRPMIFADADQAAPRDPPTAVRHLDARPIFDDGHEPLPAILALIETMGPEEALVVEAPFHPAPLRRLLRRRGYRSRAETLAPNHWRCSFVPEPRGVAGEVRIGVVQSSGARPTGGVLGDVARRLAADGRRVAGVILADEDAPAPGEGHCNMVLTVLPDGSRVAIGQDLGAEARGCRLDAAALETAVGLTDCALEQAPELLIINKFGKRESEGAGFRQTIARAIEMGIPVLVGVAPAERAALEAFIGAPPTLLPEDADAILAWLRAV